MNPQTQKLERAKRLFMEYDGSRFYMSRDGIENEYASYGVTVATEIEWIQELENEKLKKIEEKGNWKVVYFFTNRHDYRYLDRFLDTVPRGNYTEKCAYLRSLIKAVDWGYFREKKLGREDLMRIFDFIRTQHPEIRKSVRSKSSIEFVDRILEDITKLETRLEQGCGEEC